MTSVDGTSPKPGPRSAEGVSPTAARVVATRTSDGVECEGPTFDWYALDQEEKLLKDLACAESASTALAVSRVATEILCGSDVGGGSELKLEIGKHSLPVNVEPTVEVSCGIGYDCRSGVERQS